MTRAYLEDDCIYDSLVSAAASLDGFGRPESAVVILKNAALAKPCAEIFDRIISKANRLHDADSVKAAAQALREIHARAGDTESLQALDRMMAAAPRQEKRNRLPRVAGIMDEFTAASYAPECIYLPLNPRTACRQIENFRPDFVFVESAWHGNDGAFEFPQMDPKEIEEKKQRTLSYLDLWRDVFRAESSNLQFVFVSETCAARRARM